jgi:uncharacterized protein (UPF0147 family)
VGIPELKDRQALQLEDVFIHLQAEIEAEMPLSEEEQRIMREFAESRDAKGLARWQAERNQLVHGRKVTLKLSMNEALAKHSRMVILGDPGAGKTTLLKYVTLAFATGQSKHLGLDEGRLPIFIRLYDYVAKRAERQADYSLVDYLCTQAHENLALSLDREFFQDALERGECCVCLDGLDELGGAGLRREVIAAVNALVNKYPRNRYLITSRIVGYEEAPLDKREFVHHTVLPFSDDDIRAFVTKWYEAREKDPTATRERSQHLIDTIMREPRIKSLATNPLMLTIIALVHRIEAELPHERVKLYDKCVTAMIQTWEEVKGLRSEDRQRVYYKQRRRLLEQLAYWMHSQPGEQGRAREMKEGDLELQVRRFLLMNPKLSLDDETAHQEAHDFVQLAKGRTGLLIERGEGVYSFAHLTFQEYLAATDIVYRLVGNIDTMWAEIRPRLHDAHWREVLLLLLGSLNKFEQHPTELVRRIFESTDDYEHILHRHLYLAARALADNVEVEAKLNRAIVDQLMIVVDDKDGWISDDAFTTLRSLQGNRYAATRLLSLVQNQPVDKWDRLSLAQTLGYFGYTNEAAQILFAITEGVEIDDNAQIFAARILGQIGYANIAAGLLFDIAHNIRLTRWVRNESVRVLGQLNQAENAAQLLLTLVQDQQIPKEVRRTATRALGELGQPNEDIVKSLLVLAQDPQTISDIRYEAARALSQLGEAGKAAHLLYTLAKDTNLDTYTKRSAVRALSQLRQVDETAQLLLLLTQDSQLKIDIRGAAAQAFAQFGVADEAAQLLFTIAQDPQERVSMRRDAARALRKFGRSDDAARLLLALVHDSHLKPPERRHAAQALGQLGKIDDTSIKALRTLAQDAELAAEVRIGAIEALVRVDQVDEITFMKLLDLTQNSHATPSIRNAAARLIRWTPLSRHQKSYS